MGALQVVTILLRLLLQSRAALAAENLALRQQVALLLRTRARAAITARDKLCSSTPEGSGAGMSPKSTTGTSSPEVQSTSRFLPST